MNRFLTLLGLFILAGLGAAAWWISQGGSIPQLHIPGTAKVGAGIPLESSTSKIDVLEEAQPVTTTAEHLDSEAAVGTPTTPGEPVKPTPPAVFDKTAAELGTTISLLLSSWERGGSLPHQLAADAANLADGTGQPALSAAAAALRSSTPREGPTTLNLLLVEISQALTLSPPEDLPADSSAAEAQKSWLRKALEQLVNIRSTPSTQNSWSTGLAAIQQMLARGLVVDAVDSLTSAPLSSDSRLDTLREHARLYLSQTGKLNNLINAYAATFAENGK